MTTSDEQIGRSQRAESTPRGWLGAVFGDSGTRRMLVAFAIAIALHEVLAALIPAWPARDVRPRELLTDVAIARIETRPRPTPTPAPPPRTIDHARVVAPAQTRVVRAATGTPARAEIVRRAAAARPRPPVFSHAKPIWEVPVGARGAGAGNASGAGSPGNGISGTGAGSRGNGAAAGSEPCGFVEFSDPNGSRYDPSTRGFSVDILMSVHFPDGRTDSVMLDYPWYYPNESTNPWSDQNLNDPNFPTTFQAPPPDRRANEPPLVAYVLAHTGPGGYTLLKECPSAQPRV